MRERKKGSKKWVNFLLHTHIHTYKCIRISVGNKHIEGVRNESWIFYTTDIFHRIGIFHWIVNMADLERQTWIVTWIINLNNRVHPAVGKSRKEKCQRIIKQHTYTPYSGGQLPVPRTRKCHNITQWKCINKMYTCLYRHPMEWCSNRLDTGRPASSGSFRNLGRVVFKHLKESSNNLKKKR